MLKSMTQLYDDSTELSVLKDKRKALDQMTSSDEPAPKRHCRNPKSAASSNSPTVSKTAATSESKHSPISELTNLSHVQIMQRLAKY